MQHLIHSFGNLFTVRAMQDFESVSLNGLVFSIVIFCEKQSYFFDFRFLCVSHYQNFISPSTIDNEVSIKIYKIGCAKNVLLSYGRFSRLDV